MKAAIRGKSVYSRNDKPQVDFLIWSSFAALLPNLIEWIYVQMFFYLLLLCSRSKVAVVETVRENNDWKPWSLIKHHHDRWWKRLISVEYWIKKKSKAQRRWDGCAPFCRAPQLLPKSNSRCSSVNYMTYEARGKYTHLVFSGERLPGSAFQSSSGSLIPVQHGAAVSLRSECLCSGALTTSENNQPTL